MKIGIFDSGLGGELVAARLSRLLPEHEYRVVNDREHLPYGSRSQDEITVLTTAAIQPLLNDCQIIVLACNTATAAAIDSLRRRYPKKSFIGFEPMIKPAAALSTTGSVTILATKATRDSDRYQQLKRRFAADVTILEPVTTDWASLIEAGQLEAIELSEVESAVAAGSDVVALACTHYLALEGKLRQLLPPSVKIIEPSGAVAAQVSRLLVAKP